MGLVASACVSPARDVSSQERAKEVRAASADARGCSKSLSRFPRPVDFSANLFTPHVVERREPTRAAELPPVTPSIAIALPLVRKLTLIIPDSEKHQ